MTDQATDIVPSTSQMIHQLHAGIRQQNRRIASCASDLRHEMDLRTRMTTALAVLSVDSSPHLPAEIGEQIEEEMGRIASKLAPNGNGQAHA